MELPLAKSVALPGGMRIPALGLGCYKSVGEDCYRAVRTALDCGYRHIDTASFYGNESVVARALRDSGVPREAVTLVTKVWPTGYPRIQDAWKESLARLGTYADVVLLHWPGTDDSLRFFAYEALLEARERGEARAVGVSNFLPAHLESLIARFGTGRDLPALDQIELHAWQQQRAVQTICKTYGIAVSAWSPIMRGRFVEEPVLQEIAARYGADGAQVLLAWHLAAGRIALPKSVQENRIRSNAAFDFVLTEEETAAIDALDRAAGWSRDPNVYNGVD